MGVLYSLSALLLLSRCTYFALQLFNTEKYWKLVLLVTPEVFSICIVISQIVIYTIMYLEIKIYLEVRDLLKKSDKSVII